MEDLSLHVLDVAENALAAGADRIEVRIDEDTAEGILSIEIEDSGCGMDEQTANRILDPFYTSKPAKRVGQLLQSRQAIGSRSACFSLRIRLPERSMPIW